MPATHASRTRTQTCAKARTPWQGHAVTGLAALLIAAAATTSTAMPAGPNGKAVVRTAGDAGDAGDADVQRARRLSWNDVVSYGSRAVSNLEKDINGGDNDVMNGLASAGKAGTHWLSGAVNDVKTFNLPGYGKHCGKDNNHNDNVAAIDPVDKACQFHDTCTSTDYDDRSPRFKRNFDRRFVADWGSKTGKNYGSCSCEKQSRFWAASASCNGLGWFRSWHCEINKALVVAFFEANVQAMC